MAKKFYLILAALMMAMTVGCGSSSKTSTNTSTQPLDPQGNWMFTLTDSNNQAWSFGGQLYELKSPVVTSNGMGPIGVDYCSGVGSIIANGQASGTDSISLTLSAIDMLDGYQPPAYTLTGTVAADQAHMSGSFTSTNTDSCTSSAPGTWTALLIPPVTGTWTGTSGGVAVTAALTENTDQTSADMGYLTGSVTLSGSPCILSGSYTLQNSLHVGATVVVDATDTNGVNMTSVFAVSPSAPTVATGTVYYAGGSCDGQSFPFSLAGTLTQ